MTVWDHKRKGRIEGEVIRDDGEWVTVELKGDHVLRMFSRDDDGARSHGELLTCRKSFLTEIEP